MNKMMGNLIEYLLRWNGCSHTHFPEYLPRIAGDNFCAEMFGYLNAKRSLSDPGGTSQDEQGFGWDGIQKRFSDIWTTGIEQGNVRIMVKS